MFTPRIGTNTPPNLGTDSQPAGTSAQTQGGPEQAASSSGALTGRTPSPGGPSTLRAAPQALANILGGASPMGVDPPDGLLPRFNYRHADGSRDRFDALQGLPRAAAALDEAQKAVWADAIALLSGGQVREVLQDPQHHVQVFHVTPRDGRAGGEGFELAVQLHEGTVRGVQVASLNRPRPMVRREFMDVPLPSLTPQPAGFGALPAEMGAMIVGRMLSVLSEDDAALIAMSSTNRAWRQTLAGERPGALFAASLVKDGVVTSAQDVREALESSASGPAVKTHPDPAPPGMPLNMTQLDTPASRARGMRALTTRAMRLGTTEFAKSRPTLLAATRAFGNPLKDPLQRTLPGEPLRPVDAEAIRGYDDQMEAASADPNEWKISSRRLLHMRALTEVAKTLDRVAPEGLENMQLLRRATPEQVKQVIALHQEHGPPRHVAESTVERCLHAFIEVMGER